MSKELLNSSRQYQIWEYTVGHQQLLLRSIKAPDQPTRIDILFKNVAAIHLPASWQGLTISEASASERGDLQLQVEVAHLGDRKVFVVRGANFVGYVIAGVMAWHEDEGEYYDTSYFQLKPN
jgi:hypothetical protein